MTVVSPNTAWSPSQWHFVESTNPATSMDALAMVEPCTVAQHAVRRSGLSAGYAVLILGAGPIGIMTARWARLFGAGPVILVDVVEEKINFARERGEDRAQRSNAERGRGVP